MFGDGIPTSQLLYRSRCRGRVGSCVLASQHPPFEILLYMRASVEQRENHPTGGASPCFRVSRGFYREIIDAKVGVLGSLVALSLRPSLSAPPGERRVNPAKGQIPESLHIKFYCTVTLYTMRPNGTLSPYVAARQQRPSPGVSRPTSTPRRSTGGNLIPRAAG